MNRDQWIVVLAKAAKWADGAIPDGFKEAMLGSEATEVVFKVGTAFRKYFFAIAERGQGFGDAKRVGQRFGKTLPQMCGIGDGPVLSLARAYWTFKIEFEDLPDAESAHAYFQVLLRTDTEVAGLFFPSPGPIQPPREARVATIRTMLSTYAPRLDQERVLAELPALSADAAVVETPSPVEFDAERESRAMHVRYRSPLGVADEADEYFNDYVGRLQEDYEERKRASEKRPTMAKRFDSEQQIRETLSSMDPTIAYVAEKLADEWLQDPLAMQDKQHCGRVFNVHVAQGLSKYKYEGGGASYGDVINFLADNEVEVLRVMQEILNYHGRKLERKRDEALENRRSLRPFKSIEEVRSALSQMDPTAAEVAHMLAALAIKHNGLPPGETLESAFNKCAFLAMQKHGSRFAGERYGDLITFTSRYYDDIMDMSKELCDFHDRQAARSQTGCAFAIVVAAGVLAAAFGLR